MTEKDHFFSKEKQFLLAHPEQIPKVGTYLYHFSQAPIEYFFNKDVPGTMFFSVDNNSDGLAPINSRYVTQFKIKKDLPFEKLQIYRGTVLTTGWGILLNPEGTKVKWLSISNSLLEEYLEIGNSTELQPQLTQKEGTSEVQKRLLVMYLNTFMNNETSLEELEKDKKQIYRAVQAVLGGDIECNYDVEAIRVRFKEIGWVLSE